MTPGDRGRRIERAVRAYRWLLRAYPAAFSARFEAELLALFRDLYTGVSSRGRVRRIRFWARILADTMRQAGGEHLSLRRVPPLFAPDTPKRSIMATLFEDLRSALQGLRLHPGFGALVVVTLALGIGANSALFTVINGVLLRPLPYDRPGQVVIVFERDPQGRDQLVSEPTFEAWQRGITSYERLALFGSQTANLTGVSMPDRMRAGFVSADFFRVLRVEPAIGRTFAPGEDRPGSGVAILDHQAWQTRFSGDPSVVGRTLVLNNEPVQVIGILPARFEFPFDAVDVWLPFTALPSRPTPARGERSLFTFGRVRDGVSIESARAESLRFADAYARAYPDTHEGWTVSVTPFHAMAVRGVETRLWLLMGAVVLVLLIACANIANLLLARASTRAREMAIRSALGAGRGRLVRQLLIESVVLASAGGVLGLLVGAALTDGVLALAPSRLPRASNIGPDLAVVAFTGGLSIVTALLFGIVPALRMSHPDLRSGLRDGSRSTEGAAARRWRGALVVAELATSLVLLIGAGLSIQSLYRLIHVDVGFDPARLLTLEYRLPQNKYDTAASQWTFHRRVVERVGQVPGVERAALARAIPFSGNGGRVRYWRAEDAEPDSRGMPFALFNAVTGDFFRAMSIPVVAGRVCGVDDTAEAPIAIIVNRFMAERVWPGVAAIGQQLRSPDIPTAAVVVGVVGNTRHTALSQDVAPQIYGCLSQNPGLFASIVARTTGDPLSLARSVQQAVWSIDPDQPMWKIRSAESLVAGSADSHRFVMSLLGGAAGLALLLAALGTYSVISYSVARRAREVGVRVALGAKRTDILWLVLRQTGGLVACGVIAGLAGAAAASHVISAQLYQVSSTDPLTFSATAALLILVALVASWLPARRAIAVDPILALKAE